MGKKKASEPERSDPVALKTADEYRDDFEGYCRDCLKIVDKNQKLIPLVLNYTQKKIWSAIKEARAAGRPPRIIILKSRQVGCSTLIEALITWHTHLWPNSSGLVLAHKDKLTKTLFKMTRRYFRELPSSIAPKLRYANVGEIELHESDSRIQIETAGEVRGYTANFCHLSEWGFVEQTEETFKSISQAVPGSPDSLIAIESTANGCGNHFHRLWCRAVLRAADDRLRPEERGYTPIFIPWFKHDEYMMHPWFVPDEVTVEERDLARKYALNMRQLAWRRWCIENNCDGDELTFAVEYPSEWEQAFSLSGRTVFDKDGLAYFNALVPPAIPQEMLPPECEITVDERGTPQIDQVRNGRLRIYQEPKERHRYIVGADPSEGDRGSDPSPLVVLDEMTLDIDAVWWGRSPPDELARIAVWLATYYNKGLVANEANNHGIMFHNTVIDMGYHNLYYRLTSEESVAGAIIEKPGLWMSEKVRHAVIDTFRQYVRLNAKTGQPKGKVRDPRLVAEMGTLIYVDRPGGGSKIEAQAGCHKDLVMAAGIAIYVHRGPSEAPLEPLPEDLIRSAALQARMKKERDPEGAERIAFDISELTCDELFALEDAIQARDKRRQRMGISGMA